MTDSNPEETFDTIIVPAHNVLNSSFVSSLGDTSNCSKSLENCHLSSDTATTLEKSVKKSQILRKYGSHEELALNVKELLAEGQRISDFSTVFADDFPPLDPIVRSESLENFADFSSFDFDPDSDPKMARNPPVTLATVLENMPLVYNSSTKNLEFSHRPEEETNGDDSSPELQLKNKSTSQVSSAKKPLLGHSGSAQSFTDPETVKDEISVPVISLMPGSPRSPTLCDPTSASNANRPFKKGHVRHSSYETASITLQPLAVIAKEQAQAPPPSVMNRTQSLHRTTDSLSSSVSIGSLSFYSDCSASAASIDANGAQTGGHDSALGDSASSKRSSLDRRSQCSALSGEWLETESGQSGDADQLDNGANLTTKRKGLALPSILPRGFFSRKSSAPAGNTASTTTGIGGPWRLFSRSGAAPTPQGAAATTLGSKGSVTSTTGLILEDRPSNLPAKSEAEASKHRQEYERIMEAAKRKEQKDAKARKRAEEQRKRQEEQLATACRVWTQEILPKFEEMRHSRRCRDLWWQGLPPSVRGKIWQLAVGNELNLTPDLYGICSARAKEKLSAAEKSANKETGADSACSSVAEGGGVEEAGTEPCETQERSDNMQSTWGNGNISGAESNSDTGSNGRKWSASSAPVLEIEGQQLGFCDAVVGGQVLHWFIHLLLAPNNDIGSPVVNREGTVQLIHLDVSRTFPNLGIFQKGGPYYDLLRNLLGAYVCYRPDVGYVQGMSFLAAVLLLQMDPADAFITFSNLLNRPLLLAFFRLRQPEMTHYFIAYDQYFKQELPKLHAHLDQLDVRPDLYLIEWLYSLYAKSLPLDVTCRVWDVYLRDGEEFLFKTALGILRLHETYLLTTDFDQCVQFLTQLPAESMNGVDLFNNIDPFMRHTGASGAKSERRTFPQILTDCSGVLGGRSPLAGGSPTPGSTTLKPGHIRRTSNGSLASINSTMSKSLSGLLGDWLGQTELTNG